MLWDHEDSLDLEVAKDPAELMDQLVRLDQLDPRVIAVLQEDLAEEDLTEPLERKETPELMVFPETMDQTANEDPLANRAQADLLVSEDPLEPKAHADLLVEKAQSVDLVLLVPVETLAQMELACSPETANLPWLSRICLIGLYLRCSRTTKFGDWYTVWETLDSPNRYSLAAATSR